MITEKAMATHSSTLAWKIPWTEEPGRLQSMGSQRVGHDWVTSLSLFTIMHWRRKWQPTQVFLPGESQGRVTLVGCHLWGQTESDATEVSQQQQLMITGISFWRPVFLPLFPSSLPLFLHCFPYQWEQCNIGEKVWALPADLGLEFWNCPFPAVWSWAGDLLWDSIFHIYRVIGIFSSKELQNHIGWMRWCIQKPTEWMMAVTFKLGSH